MMKRQRAGWVALFGTFSAIALGTAADACGPGGAGVDGGVDDSGPGDVGVDATVDSSPPPPDGGDAQADGAATDGAADAATDATDAATDAADAATDAADAEVDTGADTGPSCTPLVCTQATDPDSGAKYDNVCQTRCNGFATNCTCASDSTYACFCGIGNAAPGCLTGSFTDCGGLPPSCSADLANDPKNCGRCGHDCGSLACTQGVCQPEIGALGIAHGISINDWTTDGTSIFATTCGSGNAVTKIDVTGVLDGGTATALKTGGSCAFGITVDATNAYWIDRSAIWKAPISAATSATQMQAYGPPWASAADITRHTLASDASSLYVSIGGAGVVYAYMKAPPYTRATLTDDPNVQNVGPIGVDANNVYYLVTTNSLSVELRAIAKTASSGTGQTLATIPTTTPQDLLVIGDGVFVAGGSTGGIWRVPVGGGAPVAYFDLGLGLGGANAMASDGTNLYWISPSATTYVYEKPVVGGYAQRIALPVAGFPTSLLLVDANRVYWTDGVSGQFRWLPKSYQP